MRDLYKIVDLYAFLDPRLAKARAVDGGIRADLNIIIDLNDPELLNLFLSAINHFKTETIRTDHRAAVNDDP